jgi:DNA helicase II / ATP-dependent DNA helicase PcrA
MSTHDPALAPTAPLDRPDAARPGAEEVVYPTADQVLAALDPEQRQVAESQDGERAVVVLAGAGTGKTRAVTHRIAYGVLTGRTNPRHVLAVTFTAKAAGEMRLRLRALGVPGVQARTFHSAALRQLRYFWPRAVGGRLPDIMPHKVGTVAQACASLGLTVDKAALRDIASEIEWAKVSMILPEDYARVLRSRGRPTVDGFDASTVARVLARYEDLKSDAGLIDFEDVLILLSGVMEDRPDIAGEIRDQYRHFVVDEYQDVNPLQHRLLTLWLGGREDLCVVGDAAQTIYSFTGASPHHLLDFAAEHKGALTVRLERNYRSTPQIVSAANALLASARGRRDQHLTLVAQRDAGPKPDYVEYADDPSEAEGVADRIAQLLDEGEAPRDMAILFRTNGQSESYEQALSRRGIGYLVKGGDRFFDRPEVRGALTALRAAAKVDVDDVQQAVRDVLSSQGWSATAPEGTGAVRQRWESLNALVEVADTIAARPDAGLQDVVAELAERAETQNAPAVDGVTLASIHAAKGLEWDTVFVVGATEGLLPISFAKKDAEIEEERRLFYVAVTRARTRLQVSWSLARTAGARASRRASRFLDPLLDSPTAGRPARAQSATATRRRTGSKRAALFHVCRVCGTSLATGAEKKVGRCADCDPTYDEALFDALRDWRLDLAREGKVPAYTVFTDATLTAIAELTPSDRDALSQIPGIGASKLEKYGEQVLEIVGRFAVRATEKSS